MAENERSVLTVAEVSKLLGLSKNATYQAIARNEIPHVRIGDRILIPRSALERFLSPSPAAAGAK